MGVVSPRAVLVTRASDYELVVARHGTRAQAEFFLKGRGQSLEAADERHAKQKEAEQAAATGVQVLPSSGFREAVLAAGDHVADAAGRWFLEEGKDETTEARKAG